MRTDPSRGEKQRDSGRDRKRQGGGVGWAGREWEWGMADGTGKQARASFLGLTI